MKWKTLFKKNSNKEKESKTKEGIIKGNESNVENVIDKEALQNTGVSLVEDKMVLATVTPIVEINRIENQPSIRKRCMEEVENKKFDFHTVTYDTIDIEQVKEFITQVSNSTKDIKCYYGMFERLRDQNLTLQVSELTKNIQEIYHDIDRIEDELSLLKQKESKLIIFFIQYTDVINDTNERKLKGDEFQKVKDELEPQINQFNDERKQFLKEKKLLNQKILGVMKKVEAFYESYKNIINSIKI